ncbi:hypothetical protein [Streptomyces profundus]|uniref:hypothetical protein n=1 Tax=Streptomyces profundus TaxID=2867410 RepID=UPI001D16F539|nr:hypothetical protein [Streptomyces sp. MA3_2.13]UED85445.1 hypothetical protein K4G22_15575 [Streptomyces sp. MA3_2.13]
MLQTLVVGLGRSGRGLHLPVLTRLRERALPAADADLFAAGPPLGYDPLPLPEGTAPRGLTRVASLAEARERLDVARTVVHLCTPPTERVDLLAELIGLGFRSFVVEKPLGTGSAVVDHIRALRDAHGIALVVVAPWLSSTLTQRMSETVRTGSLGQLRRVTVRQRKPRLRRSLTTPSHPTVFDVEPPHAVGVALRLAGDARVVDASWTHARADGRVVPRMGTSTLLLRHESGVVSELSCDLTSPVRERSFTLDFEGGTLVGHYPISEDDHYAHLSVAADGRPATAEVFEDDALSACLLRAYRGLASATDLSADFELQARVVAVLEEAKELSRAEEPGTDIQGSATLRETLHAG